MTTRNNEASSAQGATWNQNSRSFDRAPSAIPKRTRSQLETAVSSARMDGDDNDDDDDDDDDVASSSRKRPRGDAETLDDLDECAQPCLCRHHPISRKYPNGLNLPHVKNLSKFIQDFSKSLKGVFPRSIDYGNVHTLFISWKADDLGTLSEIEHLATALLRVRFSSRQDNYSSEHFQIPSKNGHLFLEEAIVKARNAFALNREDLLIIYYGGHGKLDEHGNSIWHANQETGSPSLNWSLVEAHLIACDGNILFILDCCASAAMLDPRRWQGVKELLAATGKTGRTTGVASNSFTAGLIKCLADPELEGMSLNVSSLHSRMASRTTQYGLKLTPFRAGISEKANEDSILLRFLSNNKELTLTEANTTAPSMDAVHANLHSACRVLISIRLENPARPLEADDWLVWMKNHAPPGILSVEPFWDYLRPEGVYQSHSTLLMVSMPIDFWNLIPNDPAYSFIDLIESENLMNIRPMQHQYSYEKHTATMSTSVKLGISTVDSQKVSAGDIDDPKNKDISYYEHKPLIYKDTNDDTNDSVRLLKLLPGVGEEEGTLFCEFIEVEFDMSEQNIEACVRDTGEIVAYEAISSAWNKKPWKHHIRIASSKNFSHMAAPETLISALINLRYPDRPRLIWCDVLCIDRANDTETGLHLHLVPFIFKAASNVIVWLGKRDAASETAINFLNQEVLEVRGFNRLLADSQNAEKWQSVCVLLQRKWFTRRWVIQEIATAKKAILMCGSDSILWEDLITAMQLVKQAEISTRHIAEVLGTDEAIMNPKAPWRSSIFESISKSAASLLVEEVNYATTAIGLQPMGRPIRQIGPLQSLVITFSIFEVSEPRDAIYSLLAMASDIWPGTELELYREYEGRRHLYPVNYGQEYDEFCQYFVNFCIRTADLISALDILCQPWAPNDQSLPTWVRQLSDASQGHFGRSGVETLRIRRKNADCLVGTSLEMTQIYNASDGIPVDTNAIFWLKSPISGIFSMGVNGLCTDSVAVVASASQGGNIPSEWLELAGWSDPENSSPPDELWRTLVADRGEGCQITPHYYARACQETVRMGTLASGAISTSELIQDGGSFIVAQFCRRVQAVIWNRALAKTAKGNLALVPRSTKPGDQICILFGCTVPVVLKKRENPRYDLKFEKPSWTRPRAIAVEALRRWMRRSRLRHPGSSKWEPRVKGLNFSVRASEYSARMRSIKGSISWMDAEEQRKLLLAMEEWSTYFYEQSLFYQTNITKQRDARFCYEFLGECYLHSMMEGEAVSHIDTDSSQWRERESQIFELI